MINWLKKYKSRILKITIWCLLAIIFLPIVLFGSILTIKNCNDKEVPSVGNIIPLIISSDSMEDTIYVGDLIFIKKAKAKDINNGDIISFWDPVNSDVIVTHRVDNKYEENGKIFFKTKGDNNNSIDTYPVSEDALLGIYVGKIGFIGRVALFLQTTNGLIFCLLIPMTLLLVIDYIIRKKTDDEKDKIIESLNNEVSDLKKQLEEKNK